MPFQLPDPATPAGASVARRLRDDLLIWLTMVDAKGTPQSVPVWFLWDETQATLLIYNRANAKRLAHIQRNPRVSLHLEAGGGRDCIVITGEAYVSRDDPPADQVSAYREKYQDFMNRYNLPPERLAEDLTVAMHIRPTALRHTANGT